MRSALQVLLSLALGVATGLVLHAWGGGGAGATIVTVLSTVGSLFVAAIRMPVVPLVIATVAAGAARSGGGDASGRIAIRALVAAAVLLVATGLASGFLADVLLGVLPMSETFGTADLPKGALPSPGQWLVELVPVNPVKAAADGQLLPLLVFSLAFGLAARGLGAQRERLVHVLDTVRDAMLRIVGVVLRAAPLGVFALAASFAAAQGGPVLRALASFVIAVFAACALAIASQYLLVALARRSVVAFARALLPAQLVAVASRSSLAALPAMIDGVRNRLRVSTAASDVVLPVAAAAYRLGGACGVMTSAVMVARMSGMDVSPMMIVTGALLTAAMSLAIPGVPGGSIVALVPVLAGLGLPTAPAAVLYGVDPLIDMARTATNVTGQFTLAVLADAPRERE